MVWLAVLRRWFTPYATEGELQLDWRFECWTIEDASRGLRQTMSVDEILDRKVPGLTAIPTGIYEVELYNSPRRGPDTLQLVGIPGFSFIQIHVANRPEELEACIAVGQDRTASFDDWIGRSRLALEALRSQVVPRLRDGEPGRILIEEVTPV